jgi:hypothetical protein
MRIVSWRYLLAGNRDKGICYNAELIGGCAGGAHGLVRRVEVLMKTKKKLEKSCQPD